MGYFKKIKLNNFRNFKSYEIEFSKNCNIFYGKNGSGKTNLLESISLFGKGKGIRNDLFNKMIKANEDAFINTSEFFSLEEKYNIKVYSEKNNNKFLKKISINENYSKENINFLNSLLTFIFFLPEMDRLFLSSPSYRRNFIDKFIFSNFKNYNVLINNYKKKIFERNKLLHLNSYDEEWINKLEQDIADFGIKIYDHRILQIKALQRNLNILNKKNNLPFIINIKYLDDFYNDNLNFEYYLSSLKLSRKLDILTGGTKYGPHKSDFICSIDKGFATDQLSTGQQKTIVLLLILAQSNYLVNEIKKKPVILMDEVCSHLDSINRSLLLKLTKEFDLQIFFTGTDKKMFSFLSTNANYYNITT